MLLWVLQISISSLLFICIVHYLIDYLKTTFTTPRRVAIDDEKYEKIYSLMRGPTTGPNNDPNISMQLEEIPSQVTLLDQLPPVEMENEATMKEELKQFLKQMDY